MLKTLCIAFLAFPLVWYAESTSPQNSQQPEKVAEGQYMDWKDGHIVQDTSQSWALWKTRDGFELSDQLPPNKADALMGTLGQAIRSSMSPKLQTEFDHSTILQSISARFTKDWAVEELELRGARLSDGKTVEIAHCTATGQRTICKGANGRVQADASAHFLDSHLFPLLFTEFVRSSGAGVSKPTELKFAILDEKAKKLNLALVSSLLRNAGPDKLAIGQYGLQANKYVLDMKESSAAWQITLWASSDGLILAMEDSRNPGLRTELTKYKKYAAF